MSVQAEHRMGRVGAVVCLMIGAVILVLFSIMLMNNKSSADAIKDAVYVGSGAILPEYEGKTVIINGLFSLDQPVYDEEYGITIFSARASRSVQVYEEKYDDEKETYVYQWGTGLPTTFTGKASVGGLLLADKLIDSMPLVQKYTDFNSDELIRAGLIFYEDSSNAQRYFLTEAPDAIACEVSADRWTRLSELAEYIGARRLYYNCTDIMDGSPVTVIGCLNGNRLDSPKDFFGVCVISGTLNKDGIKQVFDSDARIANIVALTLAFAFLCIGAVKLRRTL